MLVDVVVDTAPSDPRKRYQLAKALSSLPAPAPTFSAAQQALSIPHAVLMEGRTRETARALIEVVREHGGRATTTPHVAERVAEEPAPAGGSRFGSTVILLALVALAAWAWRWQIRNAPTEISLPDARTVAVAPALDVRVIGDRATPATVRLRCASSLGSGFFVAPDLVLTHAHLLCPAGEPLRAVFPDGRTATAQTVQRDDWLDLALVRVPGAGAAPLPLGDAMSLRNGDRVVFLATPEGPEFMVHQAIVSNTARSLFGLAFLQIDGNVNAGTSGAPLLDGQGRVVGILAGKLDRTEGLGFVLPVNYAYAGEKPLLAPPAEPKPDSARWSTLLARVGDADRIEVSRFAAEDPQPALLDLSTLPGQGLVAVVAQRSNTPVAPRPQNLTFVFRSSGRVLCEVKAVADDWRKLDAATAAGRSRGSRYALWLQKNGLLDDAYQSSVALQLDGCPTDEMADSEAVLQGGDERADRLEM